MYQLFQVTRPRSRFTSLNLIDKWLKRCENLNFLLPRLSRFFSIPPKFICFKTHFFEAETHALEHFNIYQLLTNEINIINHFDECEANEKNRNWCSSSSNSIFFQFSFDCLFSHFLSTVFHHSTIHKNQIKTRQPNDAIGEDKFVTLHIIKAVRVSASTAVIKAQKYSKFVA